MQVRDRESRAFRGIVALNFDGFLLLAMRYIQFVVDTRVCPEMRLQWLVYLRFTADVSVE